MRTRVTSILAVLPLMFSPLGWAADLAKGQDAYNSGDYQTAIAEWQPLADGGGAEAQFGMGLLYANGFGVPLDDDEALKWYLLAADQDHANAQCNIAVMHANGWGVDQSDAEAFKWYSLAAEKGVVEAQNAVAKMHFGGFGAEQSNVQAHKWYSIASELGDFNAGSKRDDLAPRMSAEEIAEAEQMASTWLENYQTLRANQ